MENPTYRAAVSCFSTDPANALQIRLPIRALPDGTWVAYFNIEDKPRLAQTLGEYLAHEISNTTPLKTLGTYVIADVIAMPAGKATPLLHAVSNALDRAGLSVQTVVAQKRIRAVMKRPIIEHTYSSITSGEQQLYLDDDAVNKIAWKRVAIIDDVVSTGGSVEAMKALIDKAGGVVVGVFAVFTEGGPKDGVVALGDLPFPCPPSLHVTD
jgi:adenine phosphoribosyltransferase